MPDFPQDFAGKVALVTGASIGIGRATALALARHGADVALGYHQDAAGAEETRQAVEALGRRALVVQADVSDLPQVEAMVGEVQAGLGPVDVLVNNAGWAYLQEMDAITLEDWNRVIAVNLTSVFLVTRTVLPHLRAQRWGRIVNVSSGAARTGGLMGLHYATAKAGVEGLTRAYASRLVREGVTVNVVAPMLIHTGEKRDNAARQKIVPLGRQGTPQEVADAIVLCARTEFMTGQTVHMSGGCYFSG
jgi:3-oxoacyl-[acyl-carrier protein] reductase